MTYTRRLGSVILTGVKNQCGASKHRQTLGLVQTQAPICRRKAKNSGDNGEIARSCILWLCISREDNNAVNWV